MPSVDRSEVADIVVHSCGDDILEVHIDDTQRCQKMAEHLRASGEWLEAVAGMDCLSVRFDCVRTDVDTASRKLAATLGRTFDVAVDDAELIEIPICYGSDLGPDFDTTRMQLGLSRDAFIELHTAQEYSVEMLGFTPGFAYVGGLDGSLNVPRLKSPRVRVEAGSIGIADNRTGIYALAGPGGWRIIGRTSARLFDASAEEPFLLRAGTRLRFREVDRAGFDTSVYASSDQGRES